MFQAYQIDAFSKAELEVQRRVESDGQASPGSARGGIVALMFYYVGFMVAGDVVDYFIGLFVERIWPEASLLTFLALYFVSLWIAWLLAVKVTEPKVVTQTAN